VSTFWLGIPVGFALATVVLVLLAWAERPRQRKPVRMTDDLIRECRFYDDQWDPKRELYR